MLQTQGVTYELPVDYAQVHVKPGQGSSNRCHS